MARDRASYRAARRNYCIREQKMVWDYKWYWRDHRNTPEWFLKAHPRERLNQKPIYIQADQHRVKQATTTNVIHAMLKRGDYAAAVRRMYGSGQAED